MYATCKEHVLEGARGRSKYFAALTDGPPGSCFLLRVTCIYRHCHHDYRLVVRSRPTSSYKWQERSTRSRNMVVNYNFVRLWNIARELNECGCKWAGEHCFWYVVETRCSVSNSKRTRETGEVGLQSQEI